VTAFYGKERWETIFIQVDGGYGYVPALGVTYDLLNVKASKNGGLFAAKEVTEEGWRDLEDGYYSILWSESDMDTMGEFYWVMDIPSLGVGFRGSFDVDPAPFYIDSTAPTCVVTGNIVDIGGDPLVLNVLSFRPRNVPGAAGQSFVASGHIRTSTDAYGNFSVKLLRSAIVLVEIENAGIRHLITVPDEPTAALIDLLPPIPLPIP
jgi:hypothetical protein